MEPPAGALDRRPASGGPGPEEAVRQGWGWWSSRQPLRADPALLVPDPAASGDPAQAAQGATAPDQSKRTTGSDGPSVCEPRRWPAPGRAPNFAQQSVRRTL